MGEGVKSLSSSALVKRQSLRIEATDVREAADAKAGQIKLP
jgi:hypothetical protein